MYLFINYFLLLLACIFQKFGGKKIIDGKGVTWIEVPITKEQGKLPVDAFGKAGLNPILIGAGATGATALGGTLVMKKKK